MNKYRKKPVIIEAIQFDGKNWIDVCEFVGEGNYKLPDRTREEYVEDLFNYIYIVTLKGNMKATIGDYIIRGANGEYYPCKPDIFEKNYEEVLENE